MESKIRVRVPQIASIETALSIYQNKTILYNDDVRELFPSVKSCTTVAKLKKLARAYEKEHNIVSYNDRAVVTDAAFKAWGLDVGNLRKRYDAICKMKEVKET